MREGYFSNIRNFITNKSEDLKSMDINSLGSLHLIGFSPTKLLKGKRLYKDLKTFIGNNDLIADQPETESFIFEKLILFVNQNKWQREKLALTNEFKEEMEGIDSHYFRRKTNKCPLSFSSVQYSIIEKKSENRQITEGDIELTFLLHQFEDWLKDYLDIFSPEACEKYNLFQLLKVIVSK